jgi:Tfp pilus assembly protein PilV
MRRGERGESLIEILLTVTIIGIGMVGIVTAFSSSFRFTTTNRQHAQADQVLTQFAENVVALPYEPCTDGGPAPYETTAVGAIPTNLPGSVTAGPPGSAADETNAFELSVQSVAYWNGDLSPATFATNCPTADPGSQQLTLELRSGDDSFRRTLVIAKRAS